MTPPPLYVPIVKGKLNDLKAVGAVQANIRSIIKPLIEAMPVNHKKTTAEEHVFKFCEYIRKHCPLGDLFVDFYGLLPEAETPDGINATVYGYQLLKSFGRVVTPTYGFERNDSIWHQLGVVTQAFGQGFCFRLRRDDLADYLFDETWGQIVERTAQMNLRTGEVDLMLDFGSISSSELTEISETVVSFLFHNPAVSQYRSVIVAGSSALRTVSVIEKDSVGEIIRQELRLWSALWRDMPDSVKPVFGDYGIIHPDFSDLGPNKYMNAKIRYTVGDRILYFRGHGLLHPSKDYYQYHQLAGIVRSDFRYAGRANSFGDAYIDDCANHLISHGSPATWVKADMNHHISYTAHQIARLLPVLASLQSDSEADAVLATV